MATRNKGGNCDYEKQRENFSPKGNPRKPLLSLLCLPFGSRGLSPWIRLAGSLRSVEKDGRRTRRVSGSPLSPQSTPDRRGDGGPPLCPGQRGPVPWNRPGGSSERNAREVLRPISIHRDVSPSGRKVRPGVEPH